MTAGPAAAVKRVAGEEIELAAVEQGPISPGTAVATPGGRLAAPYVIHAVAVGHDMVADPERLAAAMRSALSLCAPLQLRRVAIAGIGTERGSFAPEDAAGILMETLRAHAEENGLPESVVFALASPAEARAFGRAVELSRAEV
jgi:O-acetyl-ADP-ribose deacetylase (regulator of RNase III)